MRATNNRSIYVELIQLLKSALVTPSSLVQYEHHSIRTSMTLYFHFVIIYFSLNALLIDIVQGSMIMQINSIEILIEYSPILKAYFTNELFLGLLFMSIHLIIVPIGFAFTSYIYMKTLDISYKKVLSINFIYASLVTPFYFIPFSLIYILILSIIYSTMINYWITEDSKFFNKAYIIQQLIHVTALIALILLNFIQ